MLRVTQLSFVVLASLFLLIDTARAAPPSYSLWRWLRAFTYGLIILAGFAFLLIKSYE